MFDHSRFSVRALAGAVVIILAFLPISGALSLVLPDLAAGLLALPLAWYVGRKVVPRHRQPKPEQEHPPRRPRV